MTTPTEAPRLVLDGRIGWRLADLAEVAAGEGLQLQSHPVRPRPLADPSGALAGLAAPVWAVASGPLALVLLDRSGTKLLAYDPCREAFVPLPCIGGRGSGRGQLDGARAIAIDAQGRLVIADTGNRRLQVLDLALGRIVRVAGPWAVDTNGLRPVVGNPALDPDGLPTGAWSWPDGTWEPVALAALPDGAVLVADRANNALVAVDGRGRAALFPVASGPGGGIVAPIAIARDHDGRIYVVQEGLDTVRVLAADGAFLEDVTLPEALAGRFDPPAVSVDADGAVWIAQRLEGAAWRLCRDAAGRCLPPQPARLTPAHCPLLAFDRDGAAILGDARRPCLLRAPERAFAETGHAVTEALDSRLPGCVWDRIALVSTHPAGTRLAIETFTAEAPWTTPEILALPDERWRRTEMTAVDADGGWDAAVLSAPGRYLWIRLTLSGDGAVTPVVSRLVVNWPRLTSRRFLPAAMAPDAEAADFLDRFLTVFERVRAGYVRHLDALAGFFDPLATPAADPEDFAPDFLDWLAQWIGVTLERNWPVTARRRLVREAPQLYRLRGTARGLKRHVALYAGIEPQLIEHFRLRRWMALDAGRLGADSALFGPAVVARLQLDAFAQIGQFVIMDTGDPLTDPFGTFAHRATLLVPAADVTDATFKAAIERIVALAAPAHVQVDVKLLASGFRLGCDTILGTATRLPRCPGPIRLDASHLNEPAMLARGPAFKLGPRGSGARLGTETRLNS